MKYDILYVVIKGNCKDYWYLFKTITVKSDLLYVVIKGYHKDDWYLFKTVVFKDHLLYVVIKGYCIRTIIIGLKLVVVKDDGISQV